jgi:SAM-dependent methyltransferase
MSDVDGTHDASEYGAWIASDYDALYSGIEDTAGAIERLAELAGAGPILEFGVGTGRLAIPLAQRGFDVHGIDGSSEMLAALAAKPGGDAVTTTVGDFAATDLGLRFSLVVLAVNTIFALPDQEAQLRCFALAARHLEVGGRFVVEAWVPEPLPAGQSLRPRRLSEGLIGLVIADHDPARQVLSTVQVALGTELGVRVFPVVHRYAWPSELDLMARLAGLEVEARWADWHDQPFGPTSTNHVSVYRRPA